MDLDRHTLPKGNLKSTILSYLRGKYKFVHTKPKDRTLTPFETNQKTYSSVPILESI